MKLSPREQITPEYLGYFIKSKFSDIQANPRGVGIPHVEPSVFWDFNIPQPSLDVQNELVQTLDSLFSKIDAGEEGLQLVSKQLEVYRASLLNSAFHDNRNYKPLESFIEAGPQNGVYYPQNFYGKGIAIIRIDDYQDFYNKPASQLRVAGAPEKDIEKYQLYENDLIINRVNSMSHIGKFMIVNAMHLPSIFESNMMRIRLKENVVPDFIDLYLKSPKGRSRLIAKAKQAVNQASINQQDVRSTLVPVIDRDKQENIVLKLKRELSVINATNRLIKSQQKVSKSLRQSILRKAFNGELL